MSSEGNLSLSIIQSHDFLLPLQHCHIENLKIWKDKNFTLQEINILACMVEVKQEKAIAQLLSIGSRGVEAHKRNLKAKIGFHHYDGIKDFIMRSGKTLLLRNHYLYVLIQHEFEKKLQEIGSLIKNKETLFISEHPQKDQTPLLKDFIKLFKKHLELLGIVIEKGEPSHSQHLADISISSRSYLTKEESQNSNYFLSNQTNVSISQTSYFSSIALYLNQQTHEPFSNSTDINKVISLYLHEQKNYYSLFIKVLKLLSSTQNFDDLFKSFWQVCDDLYKSKERLHSPQMLDNHPLSRPFQKSLSFWFAISSLLIIFFICSYLFISNKAQQSFLSTSPSIRSELTIPAEHVLLERPEIMAEIDKKLKGEKGIKTVALIGIGGAGKTTLARQYAHKQNASIIWEINAETQENIINSFENLIYAFAKTEKEKKILQGLEEIKDSKERTEKLLLFIREKLRLSSSWFLIYDNVNNFTDIQKYFPTDPKIWGKGKIIITSRDDNIRNNNHIYNDIYIKELNNKEKFNLFVKIINLKNIDVQTHIQKEHIKNFLNEIPSFPLDISSAAHYLKATNTCYQEYLEKIKVYDEEFENIQNNILKENNQYNKTRYSITVLSLENIIFVNKNFEDLLLLIMLIDSQNIPRDLLIFYTNSAIVDNFIYNLKKYSLIIDNPLQSYSFPISTVSIHRSTHYLSLIYFVKKLNLAKNEKIIELLFYNLENYINFIIEKEDLSKMKFLLNHCKSLLKFKGNLLNETIKGFLESGLGRLNFHLRNYQAANNNLMNSIKKLKKSPHKNFAHLALNLRYLGNTFKELDQYHDAKNLLEQSLLIYKEHLSSDYREMATVLADLGNIYRELKEYNKAKELLEQSLAILKKFFPIDHIRIVEILVYLGNIHRQLGNYETAKSLLKQSLLIYKKKFHSQHVSVAWVSGYLGTLYSEIGEYEKSIDAFKESLTIYQNLFGDDNISNAWILTKLGIAYNKCKSYEKSLNSFKLSLQIYYKNFSKDHIRIAQVQAYLGDTYKQMHLYEDAQNSLMKSLIIYEGKNENYIEKAIIIRDLGHIYFLKGDLKRSEKFLNNALQVFIKNKSPECFICFKFLIDLYIKAKNSINKQVVNFNKKEIDFLEQSLEIVRKDFPKNSFDIKNFKTKIKELKINNL